MENPTIKELEKNALRKAVQIKGGGQFGMDEIAELPEPLYCFTTEELEQYKERIRKEQSKK